MRAHAEIIELLRETGHLQFPFGKEQEVPGLRILRMLPFTDPILEKAIASYQDFMVLNLEPLALKHHGRSCQCDGRDGPATRELWEQPRCGCPDYSSVPTIQPAVGTGSWKQCHGIGDFHSATVYVHEENMPGWLEPHFDEIWNLVVAAFEKMGLRFIRTKDKNSANIDFDWDTRRRGWIGLAIVGQNQSCVSRIWCKYAAWWRPQDIVREITALILHELGHNCGLWHTRGGLMNAYVILGMLPTWIGDVSEPILKRLFGGEPIEPEPPEPPTPPVPPTPPGTHNVGLGEWYDKKGNPTGEFFEVLPRAKAS